MAGDGLLDRGHHNVMHDRLSLEPWKFGFSPNRRTSRRWYRAVSVTPEREGVVSDIILLRLASDLRLGIVGIHAVVAIRSVAVGFVIVAFRHSGNSPNPFSAIEPDHVHSLRIAAGDSHSLDGQPNHFAAVGYQHHLVVDADLADADHFAGLVGDVHGDDALAAAMSQPIVGGRRSLAITEFGDGEKGFVVAHGRHRNDFVFDESDCLAILDRLRFEFHADDAAGGAAHRARLFFLEANRLSLAGREHDLLIAVGDADVDQSIAVFEVDRDDARSSEYFRIRRARSS